MSDKPKSVCEQGIFNELFERYSQPLISFMYYRSGNLKLAEDIAQEAFIKLWEHCKTVLFNSAGSYLFTVARNKFLNEAAHQKVVLAYEKRNPETARDMENPHFLLEEKEFMQRLQSAISDLPDGQREAFLLNRVDKKTYREIAEILDISETAVEKRIHKALLKLRQLIQKR